MRLLEEPSTTIAFKIAHLVNSFCCDGARTVGLSFIIASMCGLFSFSIALIQPLLHPWHTHFTRTSGLPIHCSLRDSDVYRLYRPEVFENPVKLKKTQQKKRTPRFRSTFARGQRRRNLPDQRAEWNLLDNHCLLRCWSWPYSVGDR